MVLRVNGNPGSGAAWAWTAGYCNVKTPSTLQEVPGMQISVYEAGQVIFSENERGEIAYVIETGRVEVLKTINGLRVHLAYIEAGDPFGEMSLIDEKPRSATIVAVER